MKIKCLLYCTKAKPYLIQGMPKPMHSKNSTIPFNFYWHLWDRNSYSYGGYNGKIVAECEVECEEINTLLDGALCITYFTRECEHKLLQNSCLTYGELNTYLKGKNGYALHISNLKVFNKPKKLVGMYSTDKYYFKPIMKAPRNMCNIYDRYANHYVLISIQSLRLIDNLKGKAKIIVRKKILKGMMQSMTQEEIIESERTNLNEKIH